MTYEVCIEIWTCIGIKLENGAGGWAKIMSVRVEDNKTASSPLGLPVMVLVLLCPFLFFVSVSDNSITSICVAAPFLPSIALKVIYFIIPTSQPRPGRPETSETVLDTGQVDGFRQRVIMSDFPNLPYQNLLVTANGLYRDRDWGQSFCWRS